MSRPRLVTTEQAADLVGRSPATIRDWVRQGYVEPIPGSRGRHGPRQMWFDAADISRCAGKRTPEHVKTRDGEAWDHAQDQHGA